MTVTLARWLAAIALICSLGLGFMASPAVMAQDDTATEVTDEGEDAVDEVQEEGEDAVDTAQEETQEAVDSVTDDDDGFDDWGLLGLLGLLGLGGLLRRPERNVVIEDTSTTRTVPTTRP